MTCENYHYLQVPVVVCLPENCWDGRMLDMSNGINTVSKSLHSESRTDTSMPHQSLQTCVSSYSPVQLESTEDLQTWLAEGSHASRSQLPGNEMLTMTNEICGLQQKMSFPQLGLSFAFSKMSQVFARLEKSTWVTGQEDMFHTFTPYCETLPKWGLMRDGELSELTMSVDSTEGKDCGSWPTPRANSAMASTIAPEHAKDTDRCPNLETVVARQQWPTPASRDYKGGRKLETLKNAGRGEDNSLPDKVNAKEGQTGA